MVYEINVLNTKYLGLERAGLFWFNTAMWKEPELTSFQRNTESTAINRTISYGGKNPTNRQRDTFALGKREGSHNKAAAAGTTAILHSSGGQRGLCSWVLGAAPNEESVLKQLSPLVR